MLPWGATRPTFFPGVGVGGANKTGERDGGRYKITPIWANARGPLMVAQWAYVAALATAAVGGQRTEC